MGQKNFISTSLSKRLGVGARAKEQGARAEEQGASLQR